MMYKQLKFSIINMLLFSSYWSICQPLIFQPPPINPNACVPVLELLSGTILNPTNDSYNGIFEVDVLYGTGGNNNLIAEGTSSDFKIESGALIIGRNNVSLLEPYNYSFYDNNLKDIIFNTGCLVPGEYEICVVILNADQPSEILAELCYTLIIQTFTPLYLVSPFDGDTLQTNIPLFSYTQVTPPLFGAAYYLQVVEILGEQSPISAFKSNPLFFEEKRLLSNILQYPFSARPFNPCSTYAWRVSYRDQSGFILTESEIWVFETKCESEEEEIIETDELLFTYCKPYRKLGNNFYQISKPLLRFEFDNAYMKSGEFNYILTNDKNEIIAKGDLPIQQDFLPEDKEGKELLVRTGKGHYSLSLEEVEISEGEIYVLKIIGLKSDYFIPFKLIVP